MCCIVPYSAWAKVGMDTVEEVSSGIISMSSDHCHDREATMTRNFSIAVTVTRGGHKQRPLVSDPPFSTLLIVFPIMFSLTYLIFFPSSVSLVFQCLLPLKHPLKPLRLWVV